jgi:hypothetical protein
LLANQVRLGFWEVITRAGLAGASFVVGFWQDLASVRSPPLNSLLRRYQERIQAATRSLEESSEELVGPVMNAEARVTWGEASSGLRVGGWEVVGHMGVTVKVGGSVWCEGVQLDIM